MAPTYVLNAVSLIAMVLALLGIQVAPENLQITVTTILAIGVPAFTMFRQWWTGRATVLGGRGPAVE